MSLGQCELLKEIVAIQNSVEGKIMIMDGPKLNDFLGPSGFDLFLVYIFFSYYLWVIKSGYWC